LKNKYLLKLDYFSCAFNVYNFEFYVLLFLNDSLAVTKD
jgi:hypothetical protein